MIKITSKKNIFFSQNILLFKHQGNMNVKYIKVEFLKIKIIM